MVVFINAQTQGLCKYKITPTNQSSILRKLAEDNMSRHPTVCSDPNMMSSQPQLQFQDERWVWSLFTPQFSREEFLEEGSQ